MNVGFLDLSRQTLTLEHELERAISRVLRSGHFVLGKEVEHFEDRFAAYCGARHAVGVGSGTDAITIALEAVGVVPGDEVITAANTCVPTIVGIERAGAVPVLADVDLETCTLDPADVERVITPRTRAIVPVHLYGLPAAMGPLLELADTHGLELVEDCAQAHGASWRGRRVGTFGRAAAFSFYPTKNLGALGDAGAVTTNDPEVAERARLLRNYGERERFRHYLRGHNSRLDSLQAAVLAEKLPFLEAWNERRRLLAALYREQLDRTAMSLPDDAEDRRHVYHLYVVRVANRDRFRSVLREQGVDSAVHYPIPVHRQPAYATLDRKGGFPVAECLATTIVSLPLSPEHSDDEIVYAAETACRAAPATTPR